MARHPLTLFSHRPAGRRRKAFDHQTPTVRRRVRVDVRISKGGTGRYGLDGPDRRLMSCLPAFPAGSRPSCLGSEGFDLIAIHLL